MIFIPFLENAFKYATNKKIPKAISLHFDIGEKEVFFTCRNAYTPQKPIPADGGGLGLKLIRQRLELLYQDRYALNIHSAPDTFTVELRLQLHEPATQETTYATGPVPA
jgi:LytS/YehU family sensor histidine kinase